MKKAMLSLLVFSLGLSPIFGQASKAKSPFSKLGYKKQVMFTSSKGEFEEFHNNADIVEIGSVYFNTKTNEVVGFVNENKEKTEVTSATSAMSIDPLCEKYYWISPYVYCMNNPVKFVDPDGRDIAVLNLGTGTNQHLAILIQNKQGKWEYFSVNGDNVKLFGNHTGGRKFDDLRVGKFDSPQQFLNSKYNQVGDKDNKEIDSYGFSEAYVIKTTKKQDETIRNEFVRISTEEEYSLNPFAPNQCATTVQKSLNKAGIETAETKTVAVGGYITVKKKENPYLPSDAFQAIKKDNPNGTYIKKQDNDKK